MKILKNNNKIGKSSIAPEKIGLGGHTSLYLHDGQYGFVLRYVPSDYSICRNVCVFGGCLNKNVFSLTVSQ